MTTNYNTNSFLSLSSLNKATPLEASVYNATHLGGSNNNGPPLDLEIYNDGPLDLEVYSSIPLEVSIYLAGGVALICFIPVLASIITYYMDPRTDIGYVLDQNEQYRPRSHTDWLWVPINDGAAYKNVAGQVVKTRTSGSFLFDRLDPKGTMVFMCSVQGTPGTCQVGNAMHTGVIISSPPVANTDLQPYLVYYAQVSAFKLAGVKFSTKGVPFGVDPITKTAFIARY